MSATATALAQPLWHAERLARLTAIAVQAAHNIDTLLALNPGSLHHMTEFFGRRFEYLDPHRQNDALRGARVAAYAPAPGHEDCPACWVKNGLRTPLELRESLGRMDITVCPRCTFCELLPNGDRG